jgi:predicted membrane GTPase involved in stress response
MCHLLSHPLISHCAVRTRPEQVVDLVFDLFAELHASDDQMDFQVLYVLTRCTLPVL